MIKSSIVCFLFSLFILSSCNDGKEHSKTAITSTKKAERNFVDYQTNFKAWWFYHHQNIVFDLDFIPVDQNGDEIKKKEFFSLIKSGLYLIEKKPSVNEVNRYQLVKTDHNIDKSIKTALKFMGLDALNNLKQEGQPFPQFSFTDINGQKYSNESVKGKTVIMKCWLIACAPCVREFPELNELVEIYKDREDLIFLSLAKDDDPELIKFLQKKPFLYEVVGNQSDFMNDELAIREFPIHFMINKDGIIERVFQSVQGIENFLSKKTVQNETEEKILPPPPGPSVLEG